MSNRDPEEVREIFEHFDRDGNGTIDRKEWAQLLAALDPNFSEEEVAAGLAAVDTNNNGRIELEEFMRWWTDR